MKPPPNHLRCHRYSPRGYRCRRRVPEYQIFCEFHQQGGAPAVVPSAICNAPSRLDSAAAIHDLLEKVALAVAAGQLKPRQATTVAYVAQVMLTSLHRVEVEKQAASSLSAGDAAERSCNELYKVLEQLAVQTAVEKLTADSKSSEPALQPACPGQYPDAAPADSSRNKK